MLAYLWSVRELIGYTIQATDREVGNIDQILFDNQNWIIRYLVLNTGRHFKRKQVLISPRSIRNINYDRQEIGLSLNYQEVKNSPDIDADKSFSRQKEIEFHNYYRWPYYWIGAGILGIAPTPSGLIWEPQDWIHPDSLHDSQGSPHLRSTHELFGDRIEATDSFFGHIEDAILDAEHWSLRYLVVDTKNWIPGKTVLISPEWVKSMNWSDRRVRVDLTREEIKNSPEYSLYQPITREYEDQLHDYYRKKKYWENEKDKRSSA